MLKELEQINTKVKQLVERLQTVRHTNTQLQNSIVQCQSDLKKVHDQQAQKEAEIARLKQSLEDEKDKIVVISEAHEKELSALRQKYQSEEQTMAEKMRHLEQHNLALQAKVEQYEKHVDMIRVAEQKIELVLSKLIGEEVQ